MLFYISKLVRTIVQGPWNNDRQCWYLDRTCPWTGQSGTVPDLGQEGVMFLDIWDIQSGAKVLGRLSAKFKVAQIGQIKPKLS